MTINYDDEHATYGVCTDCGKARYPVTVEVEGDKHTSLQCPCFDSIPDGDALAGAPEPVSRRERHEGERERTLDMIRENGADEETASPALLAAAVTHFGSWGTACVRAGVARRFEFK